MTQENLRAQIILYLVLKLSPYFIGPLIRPGQGVACLCNLILGQVYYLLRQKLVYLRPQVCIPCIMTPVPMLQALSYVDRVVDWLVRIHAQKVSKFGRLVWIYQKSNASIVLARWLFYQLGKPLELVKKLICDSLCVLFLALRKLLYLHRLRCSHSASTLPSRRLMHLNAISQVNGITCLEILKTASLYLVIH